MVEKFDGRFGWQPIDTAPFDQDVKLVVTDGRGDPYLLPHPCRRTMAGWVSSSKGTPLAVMPVKWKPYRPSGTPAASRRPGALSSTPNSYWVQDATGQAVGWFYFRDNPEVARHAGVLTRDEARRMAVNFARLPELLGKVNPS